MDINLIMKKTKQTNNNYTIKTEKTDKKTSKNSSYNLNSPNIPIASNIKIFDSIYESHNVSSDESKIIKDHKENREIKDKLVKSKKDIILTKPSPESKRPLREISSGKIKSFINNKKLLPKLDKKPTNDIISTGPLKQNSKLKMKAFANVEQTNEGEGKIISNINRKDLYSGSNKKAKSKFSTKFSINLRERTKSTNIKQIERFSAKSNKSNSILYKELNNDEALASYNPNQRYEDKGKLQSHYQSLAPSVKVSHFKDTVFNFNDKVNLQSINFNQQFQLDQLNLCKFNSAMKLQPLMIQNQNEAKQNSENKKEAETPRNFAFNSKYSLPKINNKALNPQNETIDHHPQR